MTLISMREERKFLKMAILAREEIEVGVLLQPPVIAQENYYGDKPWKIYDQKAI